MIDLRWAEQGRQNGQMWPTGRKMSTSGIQCYFYILFTIVFVHFICCGHVACLIFYVQKIDYGLKRSGFVSKYIYHHVWNRQRLDNNRILLKNLHLVGTNTIRPKILFFLSSQTKLEELSAGFEWLSSDRRTTDADCCRKCTNHISRTCLSPPVSTGVAQQQQLPKDHLHHQPLVRNCIFSMSPAHFQIPKNSIQTSPFKMVAWPAPSS